jgi:ferric-dicitrate binding protein FerR (iron transport regulator)
MKKYLCITTIIGVIVFSVLFLFLNGPKVTEASNCVPPPTCEGDCAGWSSAQDRATCMTACTKQWATPDGIKGMQGLKSAYEQCLKYEADKQAAQKKKATEQQNQSQENQSNTKTKLIETTLLSRDLKYGEMVRTASNEQKSIILDDGSYIKLGPRSSFAWEMPSTSQVNLLSGTFNFVIVRPLTQLLTRFKIHTPTAVAAVRGTEFSVSVDENRTVFQVTEGLLAVSDINGENTVQVSAGYQTTVTKNGPSKISSISSSATSETQSLKWYQKIFNFIKSLFEFK